MEKTLDNDVISWEKKTKQYTKFLLGNRNFFCISDIQQANRAAAL